MKPTGKSYQFGKKTNDAKYYELYAHHLVKDGVPESEALKIVENLGKTEDTDKYVIARTSNHTLLRKVEDGIVMWHPYIEKAKLFNDVNEAFEFVKKIDWFKNGYDDKELLPAYRGYPLDVELASVQEMTVPNKFRKGCWPFRAKTGIKAQIGVAK